MPSEAHYDAAVGLLARMLAGVSFTARLPEGDEGPDFSLDSIEKVGDYAVQAPMNLPTGDRFMVTVEWLRGESP